MKNLWLFALLCLTACCHDDEEIKPETVDCAVLVYIAGDNDLSRNIDNDLYEMMEGSKDLPTGNKLIVFVDRPNIIPHLLKIENGDTTRLKTFSQELKSSDAQTLRNAMKWVVDHYKAASYGLVLWGHAQGWMIENQEQAATANRPRKAFGVDKTNGITWMDIPDMAQALSTLPKLSFIFADCCAFQSIESAYELRHVTDYIVASPAEIPGEGAPYETIVPALFSKDDNFYHLLVDNYFNQTTYDNKKVPMSVIKTSELDALAETTKYALASFVPQLEDSLYPDVNGLIYYFSHSLFDMNDFMLRFANEEVYNSWKEVFDKAVIYKTYVSRWRANFVSFADFTMSEERYGGVNMYVPQDPANVSLNAREYVEKQNQTIDRMQWYKAAGLNALGW